MQYLDKEYNSANIILFSTNQVSDVWYVSDNQS